MKKNINLIGALVLLSSVSAQEIVTTCVGVPNHSYISNGLTCAGWLQCYEGSVLEQGECPYPLWFNLSLQSCDNSWNLNCTLDDVTTTVEPTTQPTMPTIEPEATPSDTELCIGLDWIFVNDGESCDGFFWCSNSVGWHNTCPDGFYFNEVQQMCDYPENVDCPFSTTPSYTTGTTPDDTYEIICPHDDLEIFPHPVNCTKFVVCFGGEPLVWDCAPGLHFDEELGECNFPDRAMCQACPVVDDPSNVVLLPSEYNCYDYYMCFNGYSRRFTCPDELYFNPIINRCDFTYNVDCNLTAVAPSAHETAKVGVTTIDCSARGFSLLEHPTSCEQYFTCSNGVSVLHRCPEGLRYSKDEQRCDFMDKVSCDVSIRSVWGKFII